MDGSAGAIRLFLVDEPVDEARTVPLHNFRRHGVSEDDPRDDFLKALNLCQTEGLSATRIKFAYYLVIVSLEEGLEVDEAICASGHLKGQVLHLVDDELAHEAED